MISDLKELAAKLPEGWGDLCMSAADKIESDAKVIAALRKLLKHADDVVIWEHTPARSGFQEEIEEALGIGVDEQTVGK
jgi:hypothetical protein